MAEFVKEQKDTELKAIINEEKLKPDETVKFIDNSFRDGELKTTGTDIDLIMPPVSRFGGGRQKKKEGIIVKLKKFLKNILDWYNDYSIFYFVNKLWISKP